MAYIEGEIRIGKDPDSKNFDFRAGNDERIFVDTGDGVFSVSYD